MGWFGEGAAARGARTGHEPAASDSPPVVYVCDNNQWAYWS